jgi:hypothetical protein
VPGSGVAVLDTTRPVAPGDPVTGGANPVLVVAGIDGASADVTFDLNGNMLTGNGWSYGADPDNTGEIKIFPKAVWEAVYAAGLPEESENYIAYEPWTKEVGENVLSACAMGVDKENTLHVGGADWLGEDPNERGYAAIIEVGVLTRVLAGGTPVNEGDLDEYRKLDPDTGPSEDTSTSPIEYSFWGEGMSIAWIPDGGFWQSGVKPVLTTYYGANPPDDGDGDGVPNGSDNAWLTANPGQVDSDEDGYGNACDCDLDNNGEVGPNDYAQFSTEWGTVGPDSDFDSNGDVGPNDYATFSDRWGQVEPFA